MTFGDRGGGRDVRAIGGGRDVRAIGGGRDVRPSGIRGGEGCKTFGEKGWRRGSSIYHKCPKCISYFSYYILLIFRLKVGKL